MADELARPGDDPGGRGAPPHVPPPTIWPFAFAGGVALVLLGLVVSWVIAAIGAAVALVFGFLWIRDATREVRGVPAEEPEAEPELSLAGDELEEEEEVERFPRARFLEGATLGVGALIGGIVTVPSLGFMVAPAFLGQEYDDVDLGPLDNFPEGEFFTATFISDEGGGGVARRTAYVRNNGLVNQVPSFTILSSRCVHLGCPVQPQGPPGEPREVETSSGAVTIRPEQPSGFGCPCHGGAYDVEGNRTAGPPVRALDRYRYSIREGSLWLGRPYSVAEVEGAGAEARIQAYRLADPGVHVDGLEQFLYPYVP